MSSAARSYPRAYHTARWHTLVREAAVVVVVAVAAERVREADARDESRRDRVVDLVARGVVIEHAGIQQRLFHGDARERACIEQLAAWRAHPVVDRDRYADPVMSALGLMPATDTGIAELACVFDVARTADEAVAIVAATRLAALAPDPMPWFGWLVENFERGPVKRYPNPYSSIISTLSVRDDAAITNLVVARLDQPAWSRFRDDFLRALQHGGHALPAALVNTTPCARATALRMSLERDPTRCEVARDLMEFIETYAQLERPEQRYGPADFDPLIAAMRAHASACTACRRDSVRLLFCIKRAPKDVFPPRMSWKAPSELVVITGVETDDALWAWLEQQQA